MKKTIVFIGMFLLLIGVALAHEGGIQEGKDLIDKKMKCSDMGDEQLEHVGDYLMEQMHPGEAHERMDEAMGGEGSEQLKQMHIRMAKLMYCGEGNMMNMMGGGMMNMMGGNNMMQNNVQGMMGGAWGMSPFWGSLAMLLILAVLVLLIVFLVKKIKE